MSKPSTTNDPNAAHASKLTVRDIIVRDAKYAVAVCNKNEPCDFFSLGLEHRWIPWRFTGGTFGELHLEHKQSVINLAALRNVKKVPVGIKTSWGDYVPTTFNKLGLMFVGAVHSAPSSGIWTACFMDAPIDVDDTLDGVFGQLIQGVSSVDEGMQIVLNHVVKPADMEGKSGTVVYDGDTPVITPETVAWFEIAYSIREMRRTIHVDVMRMVHGGKTGYVAKTKVSTPLTAEELDAKIAKATAAGAKLAGVKKTKTDKLIASVNKLRVRLEKATEERVKWLGVVKGNRTSPVEIHNVLFLPAVESGLLRLKDRFDQSRRDNGADNYEELPVLIAMPSDVMHAINDALVNGPAGTYTDDFKTYFYDMVQHYGTSSFVGKEWVVLGKTNIDVTTDRLRWEAAEQEFQHRQNNHTTQLAKMGDAVERFALVTNGLESIVQSIPDIVQSILEDDSSNVDLSRVFRLGHLAPDSMYVLYAGIIRRIIANDKWNHEKNGHGVYLNGIPCIQDDVLSDADFGFTNVGTGGTPKTDFQFSVMAYEVLVDSNQGLVKAPMVSIRRRHWAVDKDALKPPDGI
jgi:hypothetical protein